MRFTKVNFGLFSLLVFQMLLNLMGCATTSYVPSVTLPTAERASINKFGVICIATARVSFDIDVPPDPVYLPANPTWIDAAEALTISLLFSGSKELEMEDKESKKLSEILIDWDFAKAFENTFYNLFLNQDSFKIGVMENHLSRKELKRNAASLKKNLDAIIDIHITDYGIQSKKQGFAVFTSATLEIINLPTNKVIASHTIKFDYNYAKSMHQQNIFHFRKNEPNEEVPADSVFDFPLTLARYERFVENDAQLLKRELKLAALEMSREFLSFLVLCKRDVAWRDEYRRLPKIANLQQH